MRKYFWKKFNIFIREIEFTISFNKLSQIFDILEEKSYFKNTLMAFQLIKKFQNKTLYPKKKVDNLTKFIF